MILLQRGDITSAMSVIKNCDDWYYQTLEIQKHSVTKRENHKSTKTQEIDVFVQRHYFRQVTDIEITTLDWSQKCNDLSDCSRPTILQNNVSTRPLIGWQDKKNIEDKHHCLRRRAQEWEIDEGEDDDRGTNIRIAMMLKISKRPFLRTSSRLSRILDCQDHVQHKK